MAQAAQQDSSQDQRILREVRQILADEHAFDGMSISSSVHHGIVTLDGTVSSQAAKLASTEIENVDGIKSVMNNLNVVGGAPRPTPAAPSGAIENKNVILPYGSIYRYGLQTRSTRRRHTLTMYSMPRSRPMSSPMAT
jgi:hypothetical protein